MPPKNKRKRKPFYKGREPKMKIMIAEDEIEMSNVLVKILRHNRYSVDAVYDGETAVKYAEAGTYDAIVVDIMMPKLDGLQVVKTLRAHGCDTPVMILTAKSELEDKVEGLDSGADDYMTKPFMMSEFLARVRALTRRRSTIGPQVLTYGDLSLDSATYELICGEKRSRLTAKEYQIMELLMENAGRLISTEQIMDRIWGFESASEINVVWVNISYLRRKLKELGSRVVISSHRGIGYTLRDSEPEE